MRTAGALGYLALVAAVFASSAPHGSLLWAALVFAFVALFMAALIRLLAVLNAPKHDR